MWSRTTKAGFYRAPHGSAGTGFGCFRSLQRGCSILKKIVAVEGGRASVLLPEQKRFANLVTRESPLVATNFKVRSVKRPGDVLAYWNGGPGFKKGGKGWVARAAVPDGLEFTDKWKVFIGRAYGDRGGGGASRDSPPKAVLGRPFIGEPGSVSTETYMCIGPLRSEREARNVTSYISCKLTRFPGDAAQTLSRRDEKSLYLRSHARFLKSWTDKCLCKVRPD